MRKCICVSPSELDADPGQKVRVVEFALHQKIRVAGLHEFELGVGDVLDVDIIGDVVGDRIGSAESATFQVTGEVWGREWNSPTRMA